MSDYYLSPNGEVSTEGDLVHEHSHGQYSVSSPTANTTGSDIITESNLIRDDAPAGRSRERVTENLSALYRFDQGAGDTIFDVSGAGTPLDLRISDASAVRWLSQGLQIVAPVAIASSGPASKINDGCRETNAITIEAWIRPKNSSQAGPARIVSLSKNAHSRNITLGQGLWGSQPSDLFDLRLRTTERSANGMPSISSPPGTAGKEQTHLVITRQRSGRVRIIVNKVIVAETVIPGDFSTWNPRFPLLLASETTGDHSWLGNIYLVAIYKKGLTMNEVKQNYGAGIDLAKELNLQGTVSADSFKRFMLISKGNERASSIGTEAAVAYGVQYPDMRCVLCANGQANSMAIYPDVNAIIRAYSRQGLKIQWLD